ncbi:MAG TPA: hypothetical protein VN240_10770 [Propylenella sp.]|nr:hypothetical protein [Propylenella sp.]
MVRLVRRRELPDGRMEEFTPMTNKHGQYILADRAVDPQHNKAVNQFFVDSLEALVARVRKGGVSVRMQGSITRQPNLISSGEIEIVAENDPSDMDDPFAAFSEWGEEADDRAYRDL